MTANDTPAHSLTEDHEIMVSAVRAAGRLALGFFKTDLKTWTKRGGTVVTEADIAVNDLLRQRLAGARPDYGWLSEETEDDAERLSRDRVWVVDPIDGTRAFAKGKPDFCISVALVERGQPVAGVLFNPAADEFYEVRTPGGALRNGQPIRVSSRTEIAGCRMAAYGPMFKHPAWRDPWPEMDIMQLDSVAYRLALVASGDADAAIALNTKNDWDLAAADLIVRGAGGVMTSHDGRSLLYNLESPRHRSFIAAGPALYDALFARLGSVKLRPDP